MFDIYQYGTVWLLGTDSIFSSGIFVIFFFVKTGTCSRHNIVSVPYPYFLPVELLKSTLFGGSWMKTGPDKSWPFPEEAKTKVKTLFYLMIILILFVHLDPYRYGIGKCIFHGVRKRWSGSSGLNV